MCKETQSVNIKYFLAVVWATIVEEEFIDSDFLLVQVKIRSPSDSATPCSVNYSLEVT